MFSCNNNILTFNHHISYCSSLILYSVHFIVSVPTLDKIDYDDFYNYFLNCFQCIPYVGEIPGGLQCGTLITIQGQTSHHHSRFSINFCSSPISEPLPDTILHVDLRFNDFCIVRNSLYWGSWGSEERDGCFPLRKGELFEAVILAENNGFKIAFNGKHFAYFARRYPLCLGRFLIIKGHVHINFIRIGKNKPLPTPPIPPSYPVPKCLQSPKVPLLVSLPDTYNRNILVTGYPSSQYPERYNFLLFIHIV
uniref:Galectin n=1 Tax=Octopus bimaculoides TaxID=37653 RepID=A0A0L8FVV4_OCTBM